MCNVGFAAYTANTPEIKFLWIYCVMLGLLHTQSPEIKLLGIYCVMLGCCMHSKFTGNGDQKRYEVNFYVPLVQINITDDNLPGKSLDICIYKIIIDDIYFYSRPLICFAGYFIQTSSVSNCVQPTHYTVTRLTYWNIFPIVCSLHTTQWPDWPTETSFQLCAAYTLHSDPTGLLKHFSNCV